MHLVQSMAYAGATPWHGIGTSLSPHQPIEVWAREAGMDWRIESSNVCFVAGTSRLGALHPFPGQKVLYRSDTKAPLSVVSDRYQVVQPAEILEFYRDLIEAGGFELETAGVLKEGRKFWALARTGQSVTLKRKDRVEGYLLLATACDGTLATTAQFTSVRVVCHNTLALALGRGQGAVKVPHRSQFDPDKVKLELGLAVSSWGDCTDRIKALADCHVRPKAVEAYFRQVLKLPASNGNRNARPARTLKAMHELFHGRGMGSDLASANGTAWGLVNSVTEFVDHHRRARSHDHRLDAAWFGQGASLKQRAWDEALKLVA